MVLPDLYKEMNGSKGSANQDFRQSDRFQTAKQARRRLAKIIPETVL